MIMHIENRNGAKFLEIRVKQSETNTGRRPKMYKKQFAAFKGRKALPRKNNKEDSVDYLRNQYNRPRMLRQKKYRAATSIKSKKIHFLLRYKFDNSLLIKKKALVKKLAKNSSHLAISQKNQKWRTFNARPSLRKFFSTPQIK